MAALRFLLLSRAGFTVTVATLAAAFIAFAVVVQPAWVVDPLETAAANTLRATGVALILPALWFCGVVLLFMRGILPALRQWRYIIGAGILAASGFAVLSYFTWEFPLIGAAPLGGDVGAQMRGSGAPGVARTTVLVVAGAWFIAPRALNAVTKGAGRAFSAFGSGLAQAYRAYPLHRMIGQGVSSMARGLSMRRKRQAELRRQEQELARERERAESDNWRNYTPSSASPFSVGIDTVETDPPDFLRGVRRADPRRTVPRLPERQSLQGTIVFNKQASARSAVADAPQPSKAGPGAVPAWKAALDSMATGGARSLTADPVASRKPPEQPEGRDAETPNAATRQQQEPGEDIYSAPQHLANDEREDAPETGDDEQAVASPGQSDEESTEDDAARPYAQAVDEDAAPDEQSGAYAPQVDEESAEDDAEDVYAYDGERAPSVAPVGFGLGAGLNGAAGAHAPAPPGPPPTLPSLSLLAPPVPAVAISAEHEQTARDIEEALGQYGVEVRVNEIRPGPSVTMFGLVPGWKQARTSEEQPDRGSRVKVNSILARKNDLALALRSPGLRIEAIPGESLVVVEAPDVSDPAATAEQIVATLAEHGVDVVVREVRPAGDGYLFGLEPGWTRRARPAPEPAAGQTSGNRVRVQSILAREKDLALALAAPSLRIQAPVPGESIVGVEVPNKSSSLVTIRTVMESDEYRRMREAGGLPVALGLAPAGEPVAIDLAKMPHLLIAGSTGSGKSVCMNTIISSLIKDQPPSRVRMLLIDPKRVELTPYNGIPHLATPVVVEPDQVVRLLRGAVREMERRYKLLEEAAVRNIQSYNKSRSVDEQLPYFVICIDELADLMLTAPADVETCLVRLAQLARAVGIHLVVATQRPSVNVITGLIKANFPSRIAFYVASQIDSRTILDFGGAESLLGRGDMLFLSSDSPKARRVQGVFISEEETAALSDHWREQPPDSNLREIPLEEMAREAEVAEAESSGGGGDFDENDSLYDRALQVAAANRQLSTSLLQRRLRIGYPRAARLMDQLEEEGIVASTGDPGKPREVIYIPDV